jgi:phage baseplate assembly protein W
VTPTYDGKAFLGRGWAFPPRVGPDGDIAEVDHEEDVHEAIQIILGTSLGERVMRPTFGAGLRELIFETATTSTIALVRYRVEQALILWEPRIDVKDVQVELRTTGLWGDGGSGPPAALARTADAARQLPAPPMVDGQPAPQALLALATPTRSPAVAPLAPTVPTAPPAAAGGSITGGNCLLITISYQVRATNTAYNLVFPFYLQEGGGP